MKISISKKLKLEKNTVAGLNPGFLRRIHGGDVIELTGDCYPVTNMDCLVRDSFDAEPCGTGDNFSLTNECCATNPSMMIGCLGPNTQPPRCQPG